MTGGELPALSVMDAVARFVPGVLGKLVSAEEDSFPVPFWSILSTRGPFLMRGKSAGYSPIWRSRKDWCLAP